MNVSLPVPRRSIDMERPASLNPHITVSPADTVIDVQDENKTTIVAQNVINQTAVVTEVKAPVKKKNGGVKKMVKNNAGCVSGSAGAVAGAIIAFVVSSVIWGVGTGLRVQGDNQGNQTMQLVGNIFIYIGIALASGGSVGGGVAGAFIGNRTLPKQINTLLAD